MTNAVRMFFAGLTGLLSLAGLLPESMMEAATEYATQTAVGAGAIWVGWELYRARKKRKDQAP